MNDDGESVRLGTTEDEQGDNRMAEPIQEAAILRYLHELERTTKQRVGVVPEDVLCDARDFLSHDLDALHQPDTAWNDDQLYEALVDAVPDPIDRRERWLNRAKDDLCGQAHSAVAVPKWRPMLPPDTPELPLVARP
jgi:hypothetical protein